MTPVAPPRELTREVWGELLAATDSDTLIRLADAALAAAGDDALEILRAPHVGTVVTQVREPLAKQRFILGDIVVTTAEVSLAGTRGWSMRMGEDTRAALAQAVLDAELEASGPTAADVRALLAEVDSRRAAVRAAQWARLTPTIVEFEEIA